MSVDRDSLGDRMKNYERVTQTVLPARFYVEAKMQAAALFEQGVSAYRVTTILNLGQGTAYCWLRRWREGGIDRLLNRPVPHDHVPLNQREAEVLDGLMLGDGSLYVGAGRNACLHISRSAVDLAYLEWTAGVFGSRMAGEEVHVREVLDSRTGKTYQSARLRTRSDSAFQQQWLRWYPHGKKIVPEDLALTPQVVAIWIADDGHVLAASRRCPEIRLATQGFLERDVRRLAESLEDRYAGRFSVHQEGQKPQFTIRCGGRTAREVLRDVDPVFPPIPRKTDRWRKTDLLIERVPPPPCRYCQSARVLHWGKTSSGVRKFKCKDCCQVSRGSYERRPRGVVFQ